MNCPRCGKPIGGYVRAGTVENARVAKGLCPHCGSSMPSGYKVGYASSFAPPPPKTYDNATCRKMAEWGRAQFVAILLDSILLGIAVAMLEGIWVGIILGALLCLIFGGYVLIRPAVFFSVIPDAKTTSSPPKNKAMWIAWSISLFLSFTFSVSENTLPKGWPFLLAGYALAVFFNIIFRIKPYEASEEAYRRSTNDEMIIKRVYELYCEGELTCGKCGRTIDKYRHFSVAPRDGGAIILCDYCLPVDKPGTKKIGDITFRQI